MFDTPVSRVTKRRSVLTASPEISVVDAAKRMRKRKVGAILVVENDQLAGIFTERDIAFRVVAAGLDPKTTRVDEVMTRSPLTIGPRDCLGQALLIMHEYGFRHLPVLDGGKLVGIISARSAMDPDLEEFVCEVERREHLLSKRRGNAGATRRA